MTKLGILGLGSYSTLFYINQLNRRYNEREGGYSTYPFTLINANFEKINPYLPNQFERIIKNIRPYLNDLEKNHVTDLLIPNITIHETLDQIIDQFSFGLVHPLDLLSDRLKRERVSAVCVLGTRYTMQGDYIPNYLLAKGIETMQLPNYLIATVDRLRNQVYQGKEPSEKVLTKIREICEQHVTILACTELSLVAQKLDLHQSVDLAKLQIESALNMA